MGCEKQHIAIAGSILKAPRIFLFDEPTSALDNKTEAENLPYGRRRRLHGRPDRTSPFGRILDAGNIIAQDKGRIAEQGRHEFLLAKGEHYARMWHRQGQDFEPIHSSKSWH